MTGGTESGESSAEMIEIVYEAAKEQGHYTEIEKMKDFGAGEDYSAMMSEVQKDGGIGTYMQVGIDRTAGHHNSKFDMDEADLAPAAELMAYVVYKVLKK